ncbi:unnamed protein product [Absidia cylindrospora]
MDTCRKFPVWSSGNQILNSTNRALALANTIPIEEGQSASYQAKWLSFIGKVWQQFKDTATLYELVSNRSFLLDDKQPLFGLQHNWGLLDDFTANTNNRNFSIRYMGRELKFNQRRCLSVYVKKGN